MTVRAHADRRFRRARVRPVRRRRWRGLLTWRRLGVAAATALTLYLGYGTVTLIARSSLLRVSKVVVRGNTRLSTGEVLAMVNGLRGRSILTVDLDRERKRLLASAWVGAATLRRILPATVEITLVERTPIGLCRIGSRLYLVDGAGAVIDEHGPQYADLDLPIIDGLASGPRSGQPLVDETRAALAARLLASVAPHPDLARRVSQIDVRDAHDAVVILEGDGALIHVGEERFAERLQAYLELVPTLRARPRDRLRRPALRRAGVRAAGRDERPLAALRAVWTGRAAPRWVAPQRHGGRPSRSRHWHGG